MRKYMGVARHSQGLVEHETMFVVYLSVGWRPWQWLRKASGSRLNLGGSRVGEVESCILVPNWLGPGRVEEGGRESLRRS